MFFRKFQIIPFSNMIVFYFGIWSLWAVDQESKRASRTAKLNLSYSHLTLHHFVCTCISTPISGSSSMFGGYCWLHCWHWQSLKFQGSRTAPHIFQQIHNCIVAGMRREYPVLYCPPQDLIWFWLVLTGSDLIWSDSNQFCSDSEQFWAVLSRFWSELVRIHLFQ